MGDQRVDFMVDSIMSIAQLHVADKDKLQSKLAKSREVGDFLDDPRYILCVVYLLFLALVKLRFLVTGVFALKYQLSLTEISKSLFTSVNPLTMLIPPNKSMFYL